MLLAIDVGNTTTVLGTYAGDRLTAHWYITTDRSRTADEYGITVMQLLSHAGIGPGDIKGVALACVVPPALAAFTTMAQRCFHREPLIVTGQTKSGLRILYNPPQAVGADRIVNAVAAMHKYRLPAIIVDLGTAITCDAVSQNAEYLGGAITPGVGISLEALSSRAAKLPYIALRSPGVAIGTDTETSMRAGVVYGAAGAVDYLVRRIRAEMKGDPVIIATGGLAQVIAGESEEVQVIDEHLTLDGLRIVYELNTTA
jgi:type III pantothenate kinase